jgi:hypothetical protein
MFKFAGGYGQMGISCDYEEAELFVMRKVRLDSVINLPTEPDSTACGLVTAGKLAGQVFGEYLHPGNFFLYLYSRFGAPERGEVHGAEFCYFLTTAHPEVFLLALISGSPFTEDRFSLVVSYSLGDRLNMETEIHGYLLAALRDLKRPLRIYGAFWNAKGPVTGNRITHTVDGDCNVRRTYRGIPLAERCRVPEASEPTDRGILDLRGKAGISH